MSFAKAFSSALVIATTALGITVASRSTHADEIMIYDSPVYTDAPANVDEMAVQDLISKRQFDKAMKAVDALEKKQPKKASNLLLKGAVYRDKNDFANARRSFEQALVLEPNSKAAVINLALLDLRQKNPEEARQRLQKLLAKDKNDLQAMLGLALVSAATGQEQQYLEWLETAKAAAPLAVQPRVLLVDYHLKRGDSSKALAVAKEAQTVAPGNPKTFELLGSAQLMAGERENAVATFGKQVSISPNDPVAHFKLATAYTALQDTKAASASLQRALALRPDYADAEIMLALIELAAQRYDEALKIAQRIQQQSPQSASGFGLQGNILAAQKKYGPAVEAYEKALAISKSGALAVKIHEVRVASGKQKEADDQIQQWLREQPGDIIARSYVAASHMKTGRSKEAMEGYQRVLEIDPRNIRALNDLAWLYQQDKDPRALPMAERAYQVQPNRPEVMDTLGWILVQQGQTARGVDLLKGAAEKAPTSTEIRFHLAAALAKAGDKTAARKELENLLAKDAGFPQRQEAQNLLRQL
jgi:putative PEP-CTERM system TPR-repeat lipoprotein